MTYCLVEDSTMCTAWSAGLYVIRGRQNVRLLGVYSGVFLQ